MLLLRQLFDVAGGGPETDAFKHLAAAFTVLRSLGSAKTSSNSESSRIVSDDKYNNIYAYVIRWFLVYVNWFSRLNLFNDFLHFKYIHRDLISSYYNAFIVFNDHCTIATYYGVLNLWDKKFVQKSFYIYLTVCDIFFSGSFYRSTGDRRCFVQD